MHQEKIATNFSNYPKRNSWASCNLWPRFFCLIVQFKRILFPHSVRELRVSTVRFFEETWCWRKDSNLDHAPIQGSQGISLPHCQLCYASERFSLRSRKEFSTGRQDSNLRPRR